MEDVAPGPTRRRRCDRGRRGRHRGGAGEEAPTERRAADRGGDGMTAAGSWCSRVATAAARAPRRSRPRPPCAARGLTVCETFEPGGTDRRRGDAAAAAPRPATRSRPSPRRCSWRPTAPSTSPRWCARRSARGEWVVSRPVRPVVARVPGRRARARRRRRRRAERGRDRAVVPDVVVVLDVADDEARARRWAPPPTASNGRATRSTPRWPTPTAQLARDRGWVVVDGDGPVEEVAGRVLHRRRAVAGRMSTP